MKIKSLVLLAATALALPAMAQTVLKIGYATTQTSHYGVGPTVFCDEVEKGTLFDFIAKHGRTDTVVRGLGGRVTNFEHGLGHGGQGQSRGGQQHE